MSKKKKSQNSAPPRIMTEEEKREALVKGYEGQIRYLYKRIEKNRRNKEKKRRVKRDPDKDTAHCYWLIEQWQARINKCKNGEPLDFLGKSLGWKGEKRNEN